MRHSTVLSAISGSLITVTSLTFSLTVVTLQLASSQFSPRLLRTFTRDLLVQSTLGLFLGTFVFALTVLRTVRTEAGGEAGLHSSGLSHVRIRAGGGECARTGAVPRSSDQDHPGRKHAPERSSGCLDHGLPGVGRAASHAGSCSPPGSRSRHTPAGEVVRILGRRRRTRRGAGGRRAGRRGLHRAKPGGLGGCRHPHGLGVERWSGTQWTPIGVRT